MQNLKIAFIGGGNMGGSLISGLIKSGYESNLITVATPVDKEVETLKAKFKINGTTNNAQAGKDADVVVLAVKPQIMATALKALKESNSFKNKLIITVMAGVTCSRIQSILGDAERIIRVMPNTPALIGFGMAGLFASPAAKEEDKKFAAELLGSCGKTIWIKKESGIDDFTALSGSAPAYFFLLMEAMAEKAHEMGFSDEEARTTIAQVALGSAHMVLKNNDKSLKQLREAVTSKGGTTYAAIQVFNANNFNKSVGDAMQACRDRAEEMSREF